MNDRFVVALDDVLKDMCDNNVSESAQVYVRAAIRELGVAPSLKRTIEAEDDTREYLPGENFTAWYDRRFTAKSA